MLAIAAFVACYDPRFTAARAAVGTSTATVTAGIAWPWDTPTVYAKGELVTMPVFSVGGPIYKSLQDGNKGIQPPSMIGSSGNIYGNPGEQLPWITPTPGWEKWWRLWGVQN